MLNRRTKKRKDARLKEIIFEEKGEIDFSGNGGDSSIVVSSAFILGVVSGGGGFIVRPTVVLGALLVVFAASGSTPAVDVMKLFFSVKG
jgi:hypothetical protein